MEWTPVGSVASAGMVFLRTRVGYMLKRTHEPNPQLVKIPYVPCRDRQAMHHSGRGDHGVLDQRVRAAMLEPRPFPEHTAAFIGRML